MMFFSVGTESQKDPEALVYYGFCHITGVCFLLGLVADLCSMPATVSAAFLEDPNPFSRG